MEKLTYDEAIYHIRKYKNLYRVGSIAEMIGINQGQLRQVVNRVGYAKELPQRYRDDFVNVVSMLVSVEQIDEARKELERFYS